MDDLFAKSLPKSKHSASNNSCAFLDNTGAKLPFVPLQIPSDNQNKERSSLFFPSIESVNKSSNQNIIESHESVLNRA